MQEKFLKVKELSAILNCTKTWIYQRVNSKGKNRMPHYKQGKLLRFNLSEVLKWMKKSERTG